MTKSEQEQAAAEAAEAVKAAEDMRRQAEEELRRHGQAMGGVR
ncbi:hypothetical protein [Streptomyces pinistramenti]|nr:hypothetical protein [Streptomyces pinistramenti]